MPEAADYSARLDGLVRGRGAYGRRPSRSVLSRLSKSGPVYVHHYDAADDSFTIEATQNINPIVEANQREYNSGNDGYTPSRDMQKVASIPLVVVEQLRKQGIDIFNNDDWPKIASLLDSDEWLMFRTAPGRIARKAYRHYISPRRKR